MATKIAKKLRVVSLILGGVLLAFLIHKIGLATIASNIRTLGWWLIPIFSLTIISFSSYTVAWRQFIKRLNGSASFWQIFRIKTIGEAVNTVTPASFLGGDPMRIYLLKKNFSGTEGTASVVVDRTLHTIAVLVMILAGIVAAFFTFDRFPSKIQYGVPIVLLVAATFVAFMLVHQKKGFFQLLMTACRRLRIKRSFSERTIERFAKLDAHIIDFYNLNHHGFWIALLCHITGRFVNVMEIYFIGKLVSDEFTFLTALVLNGLSPIVNAVFAFVPAALGFMEGAYSGVLYLMHMDPSIGITIQIARRMRQAVWILIGLILLGFGQREKAFHAELVEEEI
jgi:uncharacterized membrane protein YbhN (UPF0104 family)